MKKNLFLLLFLSFSLSLLCQSEKKEIKIEPDPPLSVTKHRLQFSDGTTVNYTATAGYQFLRNEDGETRAKIFFVSYAKDEETNPAKRPLTFAFNGGPGSASLWLHMGALGPKRILMSDEGAALKPPYQVVDNEYSWLKFTDLVFIDPVMTGFSRPAEGVDKKEFTGFKNDIESVGKFIRLYTSKNERWNSPKFLAGESYGTTRASGLSGFLQDRYGMYLNGIVLISQITNFQTARFSRGNDLPYPLFLPTYAATAWYHGKLSDEFKDLRQLLKEVEDFAMNEYTLALMKGDLLSETERQAIAKKLSKYTGLSEKYVLESNLRIIISRFTKELRRDEGITVGRLDTRFKNSDYDAAGEHYEFDPSYNGAIYGPFTMAVNDHLTRFLNFKSDLPYEILTGRVRPWSYSNVENQFLNVAETLRNAMHKNRDLKVLVCGGYYDLATPYFAAEYTINHLFLDKSLRDHIQMKLFEAGHMMYIHKPSLVQLTKDVQDFYRDGLN